MTRSASKTRSPPRKTPKQARSIETVKVIVEAAARILEERGHSGFSTNAVAERAGVSIGSLYQYFPSKDALISALIVRETSLLITAAKAAAGLPTAGAALTEFIDACIAHQFRRPQLARLLDFEEAKLPFDFNTLRVKEEVHDVVVRLLDKPDVSSQSNASIAARDLVAIVKGMIDSASQHDETDQILLASRVTRAIFGYLGRPHAD